MVKCKEGLYEFVPIQICVHYNYFKNLFKIADTPLWNRDVINVISHTGKQEMLQHSMPFASSKSL